MRGRTTFIIAHRPSTIALAKEVIVLDEGRIVERGSHEELMAAGGLYARMFGAAEAEGRTLDVAGLGGDGDGRGNGAELLSSQSDVQRGVRDGGR